VRLGLRWRGAPAILPPMHLLPGLLRRLPLYSHLFRRQSLSPRQLS